MILVVSSAFATEVLVSELLDFARGVEELPGFAFVEEIDDV